MRQRLLVDLLSDSPARARSRPLSVPLHPDWTRTILKAFPDYPPYERTIPIDGVHPHVTVAVASIDLELVELEESFRREVADRLTLANAPQEVGFVVRSGSRGKLTIQLGSTNSPKKRTQIGVYRRL